MTHLALVDKAKYQSSYFSREDHHDDHKELSSKTKESCKRLVRKLRSTLPASHTHTYQAKAEFGLTDRGAASHQAENEHHHADADDDGGRD